MGVRASIKNLWQSESITSKDHINANNHHLSGSDEGFKRTKSTASKIIQMILSSYLLLHLVSNRFFIPIRVAQILLQARVPRVLRKGPLSLSTLALGDHLLSSRRSNPVWG